jgi:hypothetical protein
MQQGNEVDTAWLGQDVEEQDRMWLREGKNE